MALTLESVAEKIVQAKLRLLDILVLDVRLNTHLHQKGVITDALKDKMEPLSLTPWERVNLLLDDLKTGPVWRFLHFCRVMHEERKPDVLAALSVDIDYIDNQLGSNSQYPTSTHPTHPTHPPQKRHFYQRQEGDEKREIAADFLPGLLEHCGALERTLMRVPLFDFDKDILLDLTDLYINTDVSVKKGESEQKPIEMKQLFSKLFQSHAPSSLLLEGEVGNGKSSLLRRYAHNYCKEFLECHNKGPEVLCEGHMWKLVVYTAAGSIDSSAKEAIRKSLRCKDQLRSQLMNDISEDGDGVLLIQDGMDELRNKESVESIQNYTKYCQEMGKPTILLSSRNGLSQIDKVLFDRKLTIEGFSLEQGLRYVERYFMYKSKSPDHPVLKHIKAHTKEVEWVLKNPLLALIFSELTACEALSLGDIKTLSRVKLLKVFEMHIIRRDQECRHADKTQACSSQFYNSCLEYLLKDQRKIQENDIDSKSPHMAFLNKHKHRDLYANTEVYFTFGHEMFVEFFSIQGLIQCLKSNSPNKQAVLLYLCANSSMRNALLLTCGYIAEYEPGLLDDAVFIIQACLILQVDFKNCVMNQLTEGLLQLSDRILETFPPDVLNQGLTTEQARTVEDVSQTILQAFNQDAGSLRETGWFLNGYVLLLPFLSLVTLGPTLKSMTECLNEFTPVQQEKICSLTTHRLLPCVQQDAPFRCTIHVYPIAGVRWALCTTSLTTDIDIWYPSDISPALTQYYQHKGHTPAALNIHMDRSPWGVAPPEKLTHEEWVPAVCQLVKDRVERLHIYTGSLSSPTPLDSLLTALQQVIPRGHKLTHGIGVSNGQVTEEVLVRLCEWSGTVNLKVQLSGTTVLLSEDRDQHYVTQLHQRVQAIVRHPATYVGQNSQTIKYTQ